MCGAQSCKRGSSTIEAKRSRVVYFYLLSRCPQGHHGTIFNTRTPFNRAGDIRFCDPAILGSLPAAVRTSSMIYGGEPVTLNRMPWAHHMASAASRTFFQIHDNHFKLLNRLGPNTLFDFICHDSCAAGTSHNAQLHMGCDPVAHIVKIFNGCFLRNTAG